jgi:hypothetical protein
VNRSEIATILGLCASYDRRTVGEADVAAWLQVLGNLRYEDASEAIVLHYTRTREFIMPSEIIAEVKRIRNKRHDSTPFPVPPPDMTPIETIEWQRRVRQEIGDGTYQPQAIEGTRPMPAIENVFRRPPGEGRKRPATILGDHE